MREFRDDSSAGSTPPPPQNLDDFSPSNFLITNDPLSPTPSTAAGDDLWRHLVKDGWCFYSDKNHGNCGDSQQLPQQPQEVTFRSAASEPLPKNDNVCGAKRPPRCERRKRKCIVGLDKATQESRNHFHSFDHHYQEWEDSVANLNSFASENDKINEISSTESDEEVQSDLPVNEKRPPEIGMEFFSEEEAYKFYKNYSDELGFSVRKGKVQRLANGAIRKRSFLCSKQGFKWRKISSNDHQNRKYKRKETRTGCEASVQLTVEQGKWVISSFVSDHNHELDKQKNSSSNKAFDGEESLRLQEVNSFNFLSNRTSNALQPEDVQSLMNCFSDLQVKDPAFFYSIQVDSSSRTTNIFWRDCRSWIDYGFFGDSIVFDTTCRVENAVFASIWGLNHHRQRVSFGSALLLDDSFEAFAWLFGVFMGAMDNRQPKTVFSTDESREIADAIESVLGQTRHRLDVNVVFKNVKTRLPRYFEQPGFEDTFKQCLFDCQSKEEFESRWSFLLSQYNLRDDLWLEMLYKLREKWSHLFKKKFFSAGIELLLDTLNTDSIYQNSSNKIASLSDFVRKKVEETRKRRLVELQEDFRCSKTVSERSRKGMEKHAEELYTNTMFRMFQEELLDSLSLAIEELSSSANISTFRLNEEGNKKEDIVTFDSSNSSVTCSCGKFESIGILCGHCIKVLNGKNVFQIPTQYVLKRWTKSAKEEALEIGSEKDHLGAEKSKNQMTCYPRNIMKKALNIIAKSIGIEESRKMVESYMDLASKKADEILREKGIDPTSDELDYEANCGLKLNNVQYLRRSDVNQEQGSKSTMKSSYKKQKACEDKTRDSDRWSEDVVFGLDHSVRESTMRY